MKSDAIIHNSHKSFYRRPFGAVPTGARVTLRLAVCEKLKPEDATLRLWSNEKETLLRMERALTPDDCSAPDNFGAPDDFGEPGAYGSDDEFYKKYAVFCIDYDVGNMPALIWYYFIIRQTNGETRYYGNNPQMYGGVGLECPAPPWSYQITVYERAFHAPGWLRHSVIYQIFPDRFSQKRKIPLTQARIEKKRPDYILHTNWNDMPVYGPDPRTGEIMNNDFYGGNLAGIAEKLPYLIELGINVIYLNPVFEAYSNHRYDTGDYAKVDSLLGTNEDFASLCALAKQNGIRIILDGVFNHTGSDSKYFNKDGHYKSLGAYQSPLSKYANWFIFEEFPDEYDCWWGIKTLPAVNKADPDFLKYIFSAENSVVKRWLRRGASGWRIDVVDELPGEIVKLLRKSVKEADPDAAIIGEVWEDASNKVSYGKLREYFQGFELDSVMNYVFKDALIAFMLGKIGASAFDAEINKLRENYPKECFYSLMNLIGGHDVMRILTILSEPPDGLTRDQKAIHKSTQRKFAIAVRRLKLMALIQMTFPGAPSVYYGDEAGMTGFEDPFNRGAFPWDNINGDIYDWFKRVISLRNAYTVLRTGDFKPVYASEACYAYTREIKGGADAFGEPAPDGFALVAVNRDAERSETVEIDLAGMHIPALYNALECGAGDGGNADGNAGGSSGTNGGKSAADENGVRFAGAGDESVSYINGILRLTVEPLGCRLLMNAPVR